jgi:choline monooxygenase
MPDLFVADDIASARTIHTDFYNSPEVFEQCREKIFASTYQFVGHTAMVKEPGDVYPFTLLEGYLNEPLLLTKDNAGKIHLLSNVCTHRGNILAHKPCKLTNIRCGYHGRLFNLEGQFLSMPEFKEVKDFPSADDNLTQLPIFSWSNWMFTTLNKKLDPHLYFRDMMERVSWMPLDQFVFRPDLCKEFHVKANWALYCENYLEGFHIPFVHASLNAILDFGHYETELFFPYSNLQIGMAKSEKDAFIQPPESPDSGKHVAAYYFWVFPNMMFNFYPWGLSINIVKPLSVGECKVEFLTYVWDESKMGKGAGTDLDRVEKEDEEIVQNVQKGVRSRFYKHGRYSVTKEKGTHHFHNIIASFMQ